MPSTHPIHLRQYLETIGKAAAYSVAAGALFAIALYLMLFMLSCIQGD